MNNKKFIIFLVVAALLIGGVFLFLNIYNQAELIPDSQAKQILSELIPKAEEINEILWGKGLPVAEGQTPVLNTVTAAQYRLVAEDSPYKNTAELKKAIAEVYSEDYIETSIEKSIFNEQEGAIEGAMNYPRYKDNDAGSLIIDITNEGYLLNTKIDPSTAKTVDATKDSQTIEVEAEIAGEKQTMTVVIVMQGTEWRLDSPTY